jgi:hypothetical protein
VMPAVTSLVMLMTSRPTRTCAASSMTPNTAPGSQTIYSSSLTSSLAKEFQA